MTNVRIRKIRDTIAVHGCDAFLATRPSTVRWSCGFSGSNGVLLIRPSDAVFLTDSRYTIQASEEVHGASVRIQGGNLFTGLGEDSLLAGVDRIALDSSHVTLAQMKALEFVSPDSEYVPLPLPLRELVARKEPKEVEAIRRAQKISEEVLGELLPELRPGLSEHEVAAEIIYRARRKGASGMAFPPIVASGSNSALPHARPTHRRLEKGDVVVIDFGCVVDGYASDMTRTIALGRPDDEVRTVHGIVLEAIESATRAAQAGIGAHKLDAAARGLIRARGFGSAFVHSLGHGVGLDVHEWPRISWNSEHVLPADCVVTIEPGIYLEGAFGVRVEDMIVLRENGNEKLTQASRELIVL